MWEQAEVLLAHAARLVDTMCTADAATLQQHEAGAAAGSRAWDGATAAERRCIMLFDVNSARYMAASNLGQQVIAHMLAGNCPARGYSTLLAWAVPLQFCKPRRRHCMSMICFPASRG
jgi:hypothetical protein